MKPCPCGSTRCRRDLKDAAGIFLKFVCDDCEARSRAGYDPAIFDGRRYQRVVTEPLDDD